MLANFNNIKNGQISAYSLYCGYIDKRICKTTQNEINVSLYMEYSHYHVKSTVWDIVEPHLGCCGIETDLSYPQTDQKTFDNLKDARKLFQKLVNAAERIEKDYKLFNI